MELTIGQALQQGIAAHKKGNLQDAERLYRAILQTQPTHPDANHNLGVIAVSLNKTESGLLLFKTAVEANPNVEQHWISYIDALIKVSQVKNAKRALKKAKRAGVAKNKLDALNQQLMSDSKEQDPSHVELSSLLEHYQNGRYDDAEKLAILITQQFPRHNFSWKVLGAVLKQTGRISEALVASQKTVELAPEDAEAHNNFGVVLKELGKFEEAEASCRKAIALKPDYTEAHYNLGITLQELGRLEEAEISNRQAITLKPNYAEVHNNLGVTLQELGKLEEAEASYRHAIVLKPNYAEAHSNLGVTLQELGKLEEAETSCRKAIALKPDYAIAHYNLGITLQELGGLKESEASSRQAIALKPDYAEAHRHLSLIKTFNKEDDQFLQMKKLCLDQTLTDEQRCHLSFALGKASEDLNQISKSFQYYSEGNAFRKKLLAYNISKDIKIFDQIKNSYPSIDKNSLKNHNTRNEPKPIFILGMPRSGTTLVEQIISSHSAVTGAGELPDVEENGSDIAQGISTSDIDTLLQFKQKYLQKLQKLSNGNPIVTDKTTLNFRYIGLIFSAFPDAKIVHVKRNPAATCWGNYKQYFINKSLNFCYALDDIITYYEMYRDLMQFWEERYGYRIYNLNYDTLTNNQEDETKKVIQYSGLEWEEKCLAPQNNMRSVSTASCVQIRQKIYQGSSQKWKMFSPYLNGALDHLGN
jgi:Flp pilus assembly protein TadD